MKDELAIVVGSIVFAGMIASPVQAKPLTSPVEKLRNANHRICSQPKSNEGRMRGRCFLFRKQGDHLI